MLISVKNEPVIDGGIRGRWEYVRDVKTGWRGYLHLNCDAVTTDDGHCCMCGAPSPTVWVTEGDNRWFVDRRSN